MDKEILQMIEELQLKAAIEINSIPNLDLYMDQVITLFEDKLGHTKRHEEDKLLTKTMINNYTKDKLLMPAVKKKYTKEHILLMILLYDLKQILMIGDIKRLFSTIIKDGTVNGSLLAEIYQLFIDLKVKGANEFEKEVEGISNVVDAEIKNLQLEEVEGIEDIEKLKNMIQVIILIEKANYYKRLAERLIDEKIDEKNILQ